MSWVQGLHDKAGKLQSAKSRGFGRDGAKAHYEFIAACSPERVRALCELAEAVGRWRFGDTDNLELCEKHAALDSSCQLGACPRGGDVKREEDIVDRLEGDAVYCDSVAKYHEDDRKRRDAWLLRASLLREAAAEIQGLRDSQDG